LHRSGATILDHEFDGNQALADEVELVVRMAFGEHNVFFGALNVLGAPGDEVQMFV
jgi:hypothetical protein